MPKSVDAFVCGKCGFVNVGDPYSFYPFFATNGVCESCSSISKGEIPPTSKELLDSVLRKLVQNSPSCDAEKEVLESMRKIYVFSKFNAWEMDEKKKVFPGLTSFIREEAKKRGISVEIDNPFLVFPRYVCPSDYMRGGTVLIKLILKRKEEMEAYYPFKDDRYFLPITKLGMSKMGMKNELKRKRKEGVRALLLASALIDGREHI